MIKITVLNIFLLISIFISGNRVYAQNKNFSTSGAEPAWLQKFRLVDKKPAAKDITDGYYLFLYERQNNLETNESYNHFIREINSGTGVQNGSEISISYDPSYQQLVFHKLIIWRNESRINKLDKNKFKIIQKEKELSRFIYSGLHTAYLILDDIRKGDRIEYAYTLKGTNPVFNKYSNTIYFEWDSQIVNVYTNIIFKTNRAIQLKNFNDVPKLTKKVEHGMNIMEWQSSFSKTPVNFDDSPSEYDPYARVQISEYATWKEVVDWGLTLKNYSLKDLRLLNNKISEFKARSKNNAEKYVLLATRFVQNEIRYMGIEIGEYSHRPNTPEKIIGQRYGDCKDKSTLLCYLLNANNINAYQVYLDTYLKKETDKLLPSPSVFNHEVVMIEFDDRKIYVDPTISDQGGSIFNTYFPYQANVLVIKPGTNALALTPAPILGKTKSNAVFNLGDTTKNGTTTLKITTVYTNNKADNFRSDLSSDGEEYYEKTYLDFYSEVYPGIKVKDKLKVTDDIAENTITVSESYEINNIWSKNDKNDKFQVFFYGDLISGNLSTIKKVRDAPLSIKYPFTVDQHIKVILPEQWNFKNEHLTIDKDKYRYVYNVNAHLDTLNIAYYYQNFDSSILPGEMNAYLEDVKKINETLSFGIDYSRNDFTIAKTYNINYWLIALCVFTFIIICLLCAYLYRIEKPFSLEEIKSAPQIGGWLIVAGIGVVFLPFVSIVTVITSGTFNQDIWDSINKLPGFVALTRKIGLVIECILNMAIIVFGFLTMILFFERRKETRFYYIWVKCLTISVAIIDIVFIVAFGKQTNNPLITDIELLRIIFRITISIIWVAYFIKSSRVKATFVFRYPASKWQKAIIQDLNENFRVNNLNKLHQEQKVKSLNENERF